MGNTYHKIYIQSIFPVKYRKALIQNSWKSDLMAVLGNLINQIGCNTIIVNGIENHVHCFFGLRPSLTISKVMKVVKAKSSKWINDNNLTEHHFKWQKGFGCFSYSHSQIDHVCRYIENQEQHHKTMNFQEEYLQLLDKFDIDYESRYTFHQPE